jgi:hypothetical protein
MRQSEGHMLSDECDSFLEALLSVSVRHVIEISHQVTTINTGKHPTVVTALIWG